MCIQWFLPSLNVEFMPAAPTPSRLRSLAVSQPRYARKYRPVARLRAVAAGRKTCEQRDLCWVQVDQPCGLALPGIFLALLHVYTAKLHLPTLTVSAGVCLPNSVEQTVQLFGKSLVLVLSAENQFVYYGSLAMAPRAYLDGSLPAVLHVTQLHAIGWRIWARRTLIECLRLPCTIRRVYKLDQLSLWRLYMVASKWDVTQQRQHLQQLISGICRKVHGFSPAWQPVVRIPYGLQQLQPVVCNFVNMSAREARVHPSTRKRWAQQARAVFKQGQNIGNILGNFRRICRSVDCSAQAVQLLDDAPPAPHPLGLPTAANGLVAFRGDDACLPMQLLQVTSLHVKHVPVQQPSLVACQKLAAELVSVRRRMRLLPGTIAAWSDWLHAQLADMPPHQAPNVAADAVLEQHVREVKGLLRGLVGVPIDKNRILFFEDVRAYQRRLYSTFVADAVHYEHVCLPEKDILQMLKAQWEARGWSKYAPFLAKGQLGYAQVLPKDKDCSLNRPIVPNCSHPLGRLFNMAARGFAYVLQHVRMNHFNLFTTQEFVAKLSALCSSAADMVDSDAVCDIVLVQLDVKDMYVEIQHDCIQRCIQYICDAWQAQGGCKSLAVTKFGRRGVARGRTRSRADAVTLPVAAIAQILLFELQNAYFRVGTSVILRQVMGVSMGSKGGPVLAWAVCMVSEHAFHSTLGVDSKYVHVMRYFDDIFQLMLVPTVQILNPTAWVDRIAGRLQTACYPASLRLIQNSRGHTADMLACTVSVDAQLRVHCVHRNKNAPAFLAGRPPRFARFVHFSSAHTNSLKLMRACVLGLFHRLYQDTLPADVHLLLQVLCYYQLELLHAGFPLNLMARVFRQFLHSPKVSDQHAWHRLYVQYIRTVDYILQNRA